MTRMNEFISYLMREMHKNNVKDYKTAYDEIKTFVKSAEGRETYKKYIQVFANHQQVKYNTVVKANELVKKYATGNC